VHRLSYIHDAIMRGTNGNPDDPYVSRRMSVGDGGQHVEPCAPEEATFWSVYTSDDGHWLIHTDWASEEAARWCASRVATGKWTVTA